MKRYIYLLLFLLIGSVLTQGFQCVSKDLATAKLAIKNHDYPKAKEYIIKSIDKNPKEEEAYIMLAEVNDQLKDFSGAATTILKAKEIAKTKEYKDRIPLFIQRLWGECANEGITNYDKYVKTKKTEYLDTAIELFSTGQLLLPQYYELMLYKANMYEFKKDTLKANEIYKEYVAMVKPTLEFVNSQQIYLDMSRNDAVAKLSKHGTLEKTIPEKSTRGDSLLKDGFKIDGKEFYLFSMNNEAKQMVVKGWCYNPPDDWMENEKQRWTEFNVMPFTILAQNCYEKKDFNNAMNYIRLMISLDPGNKEANSWMIQLFLEQGKTDEAFKYLDGLIARNPENKYYWAQYGDLYANMKQNDNAIEKYEKALKLDPNFDLVYRNAASIYKNKAVEIQTRQNDSLDKNPNNPKYKLNPSEYFPFLSKSAEYFEICIKSPQFQKDYVVFGELANIYEVLDKPDKVKEIISKLEDLENSIDEKELPNYYLTMVKIYSRQKNSAKLQEVQEKLKELGN